MAAVSQGIAVAPQPLAAHSFSPLPSGGALLFSGTTSSGTSSSTYTLTNNTFTQQFPTLNPSPRTDASLLLDPARANNVLFGGRNPLGAALSDTWTWANNQWAFLPLATSPSARSGHRMAFDRVRNVGILFGGKDGSNTALSDTWSWNGTAWTQLNPAASPPARFDHALAYDTLRDRIVLHGGEDATGLRDDVWEWDGTTWTQVILTPQNGFTWGPSARARHTMAYDRLAERVVVHGGDSAAGCQSDVWSWDGSGWTFHTPGTSPMPPARSRSQMIADASTGGLLLFGGACGTTFYNDAWTFGLPVFSRFASYGAGCAGTLGIPTLSVASGSKPVLGQPFNLQIGNIPATPFNLPFGVFDLQRTTFAGLPIPVDLGFAGLPGCQAWTGAYWSYTLSPATSSNTVSWSVSLPTNPVFLGNFLYMQGAILDNFGGRFASLTNGIEARMGNC